MTRNGVTPEKSGLSMMRSEVKPYRQVSLLIGVMSYHIGRFLYNNGWVTPYRQVSL